MLRVSLEGNNVDQPSQYQESFRYGAKLASELASYVDQTSTVAGRRQASIESVQQVLAEFQNEGLTRAQLNNLRCYTDRALTGLTFLQPHKDALIHLVRRCGLSLIAALNEIQDLDNSMVIMKTLCDLRPDGLTGAHLRAWRPTFHSFTTDHAMALYYLIRLRRQNPQAAVAAINGINKLEVNYFCLGYTREQIEGLNHHQLGALNCCQKNGLTDAHLRVWEKGPSNDDFGTQHAEALIFLLQKEKRTPALALSKINKLSQSEALQLCKAAEIEKAFTKLRNLTKSYLSKTGFDVDKRQIFIDLQATLLVNGRSKYDSLVKFKDRLSEADKNMLARHRTDAWQRYLYNVFSVLTVLPGLYRVYNSYSKYGTAAFWQTESAQALKGAQTQIGEVEKITGWMRSIK